jgi:methionyl-tRNA formyltransferase
MLSCVFMGSDPIALPALEWFAGEGRDVAQIVGVFTQPDRPAGRGQKVQPNTIKLWAQRQGLPVFQPARLEADSLERLTELKPDASLVMAYGQILREDFIKVPRLGTLNLHTSLLPRYRGASPIQTAVASGEQETGVSLMRIVPALDAGPVADVERVPIAPLDTAEMVEEKLSRACVPLLARALPRLAAGTLPFREQDAARVTYCRKLQKADGVLDFAVPASVLAARINGLFPWPGCSVLIHGEQIKLGLAEAVPAGECNLLSDIPSGPGRVLGADAGGLLVAAGQGGLRLRRLQRPGGKMLPAAEFLRGFPVAPDTVLPSQPMPPLAAAKPFRRGEA